jgi:urease accessory protein
MPNATSLIRRADIGGRIAVDSITLDRQSRHRRRVLLETDRGHEVMLDLAEATYMAHGDLLALDNGTYIKIVAAAEPLLEIHAHGPVQLARIAWHIGNRHTACEIGRDAIYIQPDHVLEQMVIGLGAHVHHVTRPFEPEGGAYGGKGPLLESHHGHSHAHGHAGGHNHDHTHGHDHTHDGHSHSHDHGHHDHTHAARPLRKG